jgi:hypothetical protein
MMELNYVEQRCLLVIWRVNSKITHCRKGADERRPSKIDCSENDWRETDAIL